MAPNRRCQTKSGATTFSSSEPGASCSGHVVIVMSVCIATVLLYGIGAGGPEGPDGTPLSAQKSHRTGTGGVLAVSRLLRASSSTESCRGSRSMDEQPGTGPRGRARIIGPKRGGWCVSPVVLGTKPEIPGGGEAIGICHWASCSLSVMLRGPCNVVPA